MSDEIRGYERALPIALLRAREATMRMFKPHVDAAGLTLPQWRVIRALAEGGAHDAAELAEKCAVLPPSLSRILTVLEKRGLLAREKGAGDGRRLVINLTDQGAALFAEIAPKSEAEYRRLEAAFGAERLAKLLDELDFLRDTAVQSVTDGREENGP
ncbi:MAG: homoprotocatechuate degradation operon regulator HpaR [Pseudomonadota bacterium]